MTSNDLINSFGDCPGFGLICPPPFKQPACINIPNCYAKPDFSPSYKELQVNVSKTQFDIRKDKRI